MSKHASKGWRVPDDRDCAPRRHLSLKKRRCGKRKCVKTEMTFMFALWSSVFCVS